MSLLERVHPMRRRRELHRRLIHRVLEDGRVRRLVGRASVDGGGSAFGAGGRAMGASAESDLTAVDGRVGLEGAFAGFWREREEGAVGRGRDVVGAIRGVDGL